MSVGSALQDGGARLQGGFGAIDWFVVLAILVLTTWVGERKAGKLSSMRDFFLAGRKLPWWAVAASIVATEISAVTYISLPSVVYKTGGDITYLQLGLIGYFVARILVGVYLVPAYYEREIYSPYDYVGHQLGEGARRTTTLLFTLGGILGQSARVYLTAVVLEVLLWEELGKVQQWTGLPPLASAVCAIGLVAVVWTWIGGIATVVWTDAILFLLFLAGIAVALFTVGGEVAGGLSTAVADGWTAGKFEFWNTTLDPTQAYTLPAAIVAATVGGLAVFGTDQLMAQRMFCCKDKREARKAIIASQLGMVVTILVAIVGVGLWAYYREHPLSGAALELVTEKPDRIFPVFIAEVIPQGFKGLVIAGAFAAAISSLDSILAALSQTTLSGLILPRRERELEAALTRPSPEDEARWQLRFSRVLVVTYAVLLCGAAVGLEWVAGRYASVLDLALAMAGYTGGALLAAVLLAILPLGVNGRGFLWSAPLSVVTVFAIVWHEPWSHLVVAGIAVLMLVLWVGLRFLPDARRGTPPARLMLQSLALVVGLALALGLTLHGKFQGDAFAGEILAWPWYVPVGCIVAFVFGILLADPCSKAHA